MSNYATQAEAKRFARLQTSWKDLGFSLESDYNDHLDELAEMASRFIDNYCRRDSNYFGAGGLTVTEYHDGQGAYPTEGLLFTNERVKLWMTRARKFILKERPVISITTVKELISSTWTTRTEGVSDDYRAVGGVVYFVNNIPNEGWRNVEIIYTAGYAAIPKEIILACAKLVGNHLQSGLGDAMEGRISFESPTVIDFSRPEIFTKELKMLLAPFRKEFMGVL